MDEVEELLPGWYRQQTDPTHLRWWDGHEWTDDVLPAEVLDDDALEEELEDQIRAPQVPSPTPTERPRRRAPLRPEGEPERPARRDDSSLGEEARRFAGDFGDDAGEQRRPAPSGSRDAPTRPGNGSATIRISGDTSTAPGAGVRSPRRESVPPRPGPRPQPPRRDGRPAPRAGSDPRAQGRAPQGRAPQGRAPQGRAPQRRPAPSRGGQYTARKAAPPGRLAFRVVMAAAVAVLAFLLIRPFITDPPDARTLRSDPRVAPEADAEGFINGHPPLSEAVLTLRDLPRGWLMQAELTGTRVGFCGGRNPQTVIVPLEEHRASFSQGANGPFLAQSAVRFTDSAEAARFLDLVADTFETCQVYDESGASITLEPLDFPDLGDDTFAVKVTGETGGSTLAGHVIWSRVDDRLVSLSSVSFGAEFDINLVEHLTEALLRRF